MIIRIGTLAFAFVLVALSGRGVQAGVQVLETDHLRLIYNKTLHGYLAPHVARCFENALAFHRTLFEYEPSDKITVLLHDQSDFANAGATASPRNAVVVAIAPFSFVYESTLSNERMNLIMSHELVHILAADGQTGSDRFFRGLFQGKVRETADNPLSMLYGYFTTPRRDAPRWYHEGVAVFMETWMAGGIGRAQGAYDEMVFRSKVLDAARFYDPVGLESEGTKTDFQGGVNSYLYGTRFVSYLGYRYGPERVVEWVKRTPGSKAYFAAQFGHVFGRSLDDVWNEWVVWEHQFQTLNLDSVRQYATTSYRDIAPIGLGSASRTFYDARRHEILVAVNFPGELAHIRAINLTSGAARRICDLKGPAMYYVTSMAFDSTSGRLFFTTDNYGWRSLNVVDVTTGKQKQLQEKLRVGDLAFCAVDSSLWGVRHFNGLSTLVRVVAPYDDWDQIVTLPFGTDLHDLDLSPDGAWLSASLSEISGRQSLVLMSTDSLLAHRQSQRELYDFGLSIPESFVFSPDGRYLYGSSYYTGVSNLFRYDLTLDSMAAVTNAETGFFCPLPVWADSAVVLRYTGEGFRPAVVPTLPLEDVSATQFLGNLVVDSHAVVRDWKIAPPSVVNLDTMIRDSGSYRPLASLDLASLYPVVEGYKNDVAWGLRAEVNDPVLMHRADLTLSYSPASSLSTEERFHANLSYAHGPWGLDFQHNGTDFYDLFGPSRRSRKGEALSLSYARTLVDDDPRHFDYSITVAGYANLDELPLYQDIPTSFDRFATLGFDLNYSHEDVTLGAVDFTKGFGWELKGYNQWVDKRLYVQAVNNLDFGLPLPVKYSSIWLRTSAGLSSGERADPQANFFFGGFRNNYVDYQSEKRYRRFYTFPGVEINSLAGRNYGKALVELILPPWRFKRVGTGWFHQERIRLALFGSSLITNFDYDPWRETTFNVGSQMDFRFMLLWHYRMTFSVGYASAFEKGQPRTDEWMWSLKIL
jgi:hypothetical protein